MHHCTVEITGGVMANNNLHNRVAKGTYLYKVCTLSLVIG